MIYVIFSVVFNVGVAILLKIFNRKSNSSNLFQVITCNYFFSALFCYLIYTPDLNLEYSKAPWFVFISMGILLPSIFIFVGESIKYLGIARTDIAQRMSLLITVLAAFIFFKEEYTKMKIVALLLGFISIFFIFSTHKKEKLSNKWYLAAIVFFGLGVINILFKMVAANQNFSYTTSLFFIFVGSFIVGSIITLFNIFTKNQKLEYKNILWGLGLGILNFGNVLFYLIAHKVLESNPSIVFSTMNLGVIILGSMVGIILFKEKMNKINYFGITLALLAIILLAFSEDMIKLFL